MAVRIYQIAKEFNVESKLLVAKCKERGYDVKTHSSSISDEQAAALRRELTGLEAPPPKPRKEQPPPHRPAPMGGAVARPPVHPPVQKEAPSRLEAIEARLQERAAPARMKPKRKTPGEEAEPTREPGGATVIPSKKPRRQLRRWIAPGGGGAGGRAPLKLGRPVPAQKITKVEMDPPVTLKDLSGRMGVKASDIIAKLMQQNVLVTINQVLEPALAEQIGIEFGVEVTVKKATSQLEDLLAAEKPDPPESLKPRAPIVTFLGHVDHGKTSLLDRIRKARVAEGEAGGITQHIGAYRFDRGKTHVTFLDTPGHESFTEMRARGANVTDVVVLVVAADDGVMPQTEEAVNHARAAEVPIVVALNKIDLPGADPRRVKMQLSQIGLAPEEYGGKTVCAEVSALTGQGVDNLLEMLSLEAELLELKANPDKPARGTVLEAELTEGRGVVAKVLVKEGTLRPGDVVLCGHTHGRVRHMWDDQMRSIAEAGPAMPVAITGLAAVPDAGDPMYVLDDPQTARAIAEQRAQKRREEERATRRHVTLETLFAHLAQATVKELRVIVKADVAGSLEVIQKALADLGTKEVKITVIHSGVGGINLSDVVLADASDAIVVGFNVVAEAGARIRAEASGVDVRIYQIIYSLINELRQGLEGLLEPEKREVVTGHATVRQVFRVSRFGNVAGCFVTDGTIKRSSCVRLTRENRIIYDGKLASLRRFKDDTREVREGFECGMKIEAFDDVKEGDVIEAYEVQEIARSLTAKPGAPSKGR